MFASQNKIIGFCTDLGWYTETIYEKSANKGGTHI